jgi:hypothetical protein
LYAFAGEATLRSSKALVKGSEEDRLVLFGLDGPFDPAQGRLRAAVLHVSTSMTGEDARRSTFIFIGFVGQECPTHLYFLELRCDRQSVADGKNRCE